MLAVVYASTAAPDLTWWDAPELTTAAQTLGIPHPPGTPLWVLMGRVAAVAAGSLGPVRSVTWLSVLAGALAGGGGAWLLARWVAPWQAMVAAISAGTMAAAWQNATEVEVYAVALLHALLLLAAGALAGEGRTPAMRARWRGVLAYAVGLAVPLHLSALVALPAALVLAYPSSAGAGPGRWRGLAWQSVGGQVAGLAALALLGASAVAVLPLQAAQGPALDSGHPATLPALGAVLSRAQYEVAGVWPRQAPWWLQVGNLIQWADWQVAWGRWPHPTPSWLRTPSTVAWVVAAGWGLRALWHRHRRGALAMGMLLAAGTLGVVAWLNLKAGPSFGVGVLPAGAPHEARERDYFFVLGFWAWGMLAAVGVLAVGDRMVAWCRAPLTRRLAMLVAPLVALLPLWANAAVMDRGHPALAPLPRVAALALLEAIPPNGVLLAAGDHDSFPVWYLQQVEEVRPDVAVVTWSLLPARWYREALQRRRLLPAWAVDPWRGAGATAAAVAAQADARGRPWRVSVWVDAVSRRALGASLGASLAAAPGGTPGAASGRDPAWRWDGLVLAPGWDGHGGAAFGVREGAVSHDPASPNLGALRQAVARLPAAALAPLPAWADPVARAWQRHWQCMASAAGAAPPVLLVAPCGGSYP